MRMMLDDFIGPAPVIGDRLAGAALGVVRVGLVAIHAGAGFRPARAGLPSAGIPDGFGAAALLSMLGQKGFRSLPPDVTAIRSTG